MGKYPRLLARDKEIISLIKGMSINSLKWEFLASESDSIAHFFEAGGIENYELAARIAKEHGFAGIIDIGCANGCQSEVFLNQHLQYVGIDNNDCPGSFFWNHEAFQYLKGTYPTQVIVPDYFKNLLPVAILSLGWQAYKFDNNTWDLEFSRLANDFPNAFVFTDKEALPDIQKYWDAKEITMNGNDGIGEYLYLTKKGV